MAEVAAALVGFWCCAATSAEPRPEPEPLPEPIPEPWDDPQATQTFSADVFLHNGSGADLEVQFRSLRDSVDVDCQMLASDPGHWLQDELFGDVVAWTVPDDTNVALPSTTHPRGCHAVRIEAAGAAPQIAWWFDGAPPVRDVPVRGFEAPQPGGIDLRPGGSGLFLDDGEQSLLYDPIGAPEHVAAQCKAAASTDRMDWADPIPVGTHRLTSITEGLDGCLGLQLEPSAEAPPLIWYLCVPVETFPFQVDQEISIRENYWGVSEARLEIDAVDPALGQRLVVPAGAELDAGQGLQMQFEPLPDCDLAIASSCGTVVRRGEVTLTWQDGTQDTLDGVERVLTEHVDAAGNLRRVAVTVAEERVALDPECAPGTDTLGLDVQLAIADFGPQ